MPRRATSDPSSCRLMRHSTSAALCRIVRSDWPVFAAASAVKRSAVSSLNWRSVAFTPWTAFARWLRLRVQVQALLRYVRLERNIWRGLGCAGTVLLTLTLEYTRTALRGLRTLPGDDRQRMVDRLEAYAANPDAPEHDVIPLEGTPNGFRLRTGNWRALFTVTGHEMTVYRIAHRREAYR